jgi:hypothetical protein
LNEVPQSFRSLGPQQNGYGSMLFLIQQVLAKVRTATIVKVLAVTNDGGVTPVGTVDVQPLVQQVDGVGTVTDLQPVFGVPYLRMQGGTNAVILDPQVGDLGIAVFGDRDLSVVVSTKAKGAPGSARKHHLADAMYLGGLLNGTPVQFVQFNAEGVTVKSPTKVTVQAPQIELDGAVHVTGAQTNDSTIDASGDVTGQGTSLHTHKHGGVQTGGGQTGVPV